MKKTSQDQITPNLPREDFEQLPEKPGVYYFIMNLKVIYVGKAVNLKKRVASTLLVIKLRYKDKISYEIYMLSLLVCGTELMALLLECTEIKDCGQYTTRH
jgi:DNA polymerase-3 subunit epsilon